MTKQIQLTQGQVAIVDDEDYEWLSQWKWRALISHGAFYAVRNWWRSPLSRTLSAMHREIVKAAPGEIVDHRDGNSLNNTRENLRICTANQNKCNRRVLAINNKSGYKGVSLTPKNMYCAQIRANGKKIRLGIFPDPVTAARAYDEAARKYHGEFARLNFPE